MLRGFKSTPGNFRSVSEFSRAFMRVSGCSSGFQWVLEDNAITEVFQWRFEKSQTIPVPLQSYSKGFQERAEYLQGVSGAFHRG